MKSWSGLKLDPNANPVRVCLCLFKRSLMSPDDVVFLVFLLGFDILILENYSEPAHCYLEKQRVHSLRIIQNSLRTTLWLINSGGEGTCAVKRAGPITCWNECDCADTKCWAQQLESKCWLVRSSARTKAHGAKSAPMAANKEIYMSEAGDLNIWKIMTK